MDQADTRESRRMRRLWREQAACRPSVSGNQEVEQDQIRSRKKPSSSQHQEVLAPPEGVRIWRQCEA